MVKSKIFIRAAVVMAVCAFFFFWGEFLWRDAHISFDSLETPSVQNWKIGGIRSSRTVGDDFWRIRAVDVERVPGCDNLTGVSAVIEGPSGVRTVTAPSGVYKADDNELELNDAQGTWRREIHPLSWSSPLVKQLGKKDTWVFPKGISVKSDSYTLDAASGTLMSRSKVHLEQGCIRWWNE